MLTVINKVKLREYLKWGLKKWNDITPEERDKYTHIVLEGTKQALSVLTAIVRKRNQAKDQLIKTCAENIERMNSDYLAEQSVEGKAAIRKEMEYWIGELHSIYVEEKRSRNKLLGALVPGLVCLAGIASTTKKK